MEIPQFLHTRVPKWFFFSFSDLKHSELQIILAIFNETIGFNKLESPIAYSILAQYTHIKSYSTIAGALAALEQRGWITIKQPGAGKTQVIRLNMEPLQPTVKLPLQEPLQPTVKNIETIETIKNINNISDVVVEMINFGIDCSEAKKLEAIAKKHARSESYITQVLRYVASLKNINSPAGYAVAWIRENKDLPAAPRSRQELETEKRLAGWAKFLNKPLESVMEV